LTEVTNECTVTIQNERENKWLVDVEVFYIYLCELTIENKILVIWNSAINNTPDNKTRPPTMCNSREKKLDQRTAQ
jgi:hypothetical protein